MTKVAAKKKLEALANQMAQLKAQIAEERAEGRMTAKQFNAAIETIGLTRKQAGAFFGQSERQGQRWGAGDVPVPGGVAIALALMLKYKKKPEDVEEMISAM